jgi:hypothetical protein
MEATETKEPKEILEQLVIRAILVAQARWEALETLVPLVLPEQREILVGVFIGFPCHIF